MLCRFVWSVMAATSGMKMVGARDLAAGVHGRSMVRTPSTANLEAIVDPIIG
jgi:hypothetical protein